MIMTNIPFIYTKKSSRKSLYGLSRTLFCVYASIENKTLKVFPYKELGLLFALRLAALTCLYAAYRRSPCAM